MVKKVMLAVPTYENIAPQTFKSIYDLYKDDMVVDFEFVTGYDCARARNDIVDVFLRSTRKYDYLFMVDSDIILPKDALVNLMQIEDFSVNLGVYPRKDNPETTEIFKLGKYPEFPLKDRYDISEIKDSKTTRMEIKGGGFGCALIKRDIFYKIHYPWFRYKIYSDHCILSEDLYFCDQVRMNEGKIMCDTRVLCQHIGKKIY